MKKIICFIFGHNYYMTEKWSNTARRVGCKRCNGDWAMHDPTKSLVEMNGEFADMYKTKYPRESL